MTISDLPALNATLNALSAVFIITAYVLIRRGHRDLHKRFMLAALTTSTAFLVSYVIYHANTGSRPFPGVGTVRLVYFGILITHVVLAATILPLALTTTARGLRARYDRHVAIARWTLPIWLYVSVTGVVIYLMLYQMYLMAPRWSPISARSVLAVAAPVIAVVLLAMIPIHVFAQAGPGAVPFDPINSIPTPTPITIRPRLFTAYGTMIAAAMLSVLYVYRSRTFILCWVGSLLMLSTALGITSAISSAAPGSLLNGGALLSLTLSAGLLRVGADAFPANQVRWHTAVKAAAVITMWFVIGPMFLAFRTFVDIGLLLTAGLLGWAAVRYFELARRGRQFGALIIALGLSVIGAGIGAGVLIAIGVAPSPGLVNQVAVINVIASLFVALGMVLLVFEELTGELRRTNRDLATANEAARRLAITDPLTGCHNRRFFEEIERREMKRHRRYGVPLSVVFIDVDRLKQLNDSAGHERGDDALRAIGAMLRREVRQSDYVIRWGGDEFLLLLTCSLGLAEHKAALLKEAFLQEREVSGLPDRIGLSVGVAAVAPEAENLQGAIRDADALMYRDKLGEGTSLQVR